MIDYAKLALQAVDGSGRSARRQPLAITPGSAHASAATPELGGDAFV
jgi:hypothetical protein